MFDLVVEFSKYHCCTIIRDYQFKINVTTDMIHSAQTITVQVQISHTKKTLFTSCFLDMKRISALLSLMKHLLMDAESISEVWHAKFIHNSSSQWMANIRRSTSKDITQNQLNGTAWIRKNKIDGYQSLRIRNTDQSFLHHIQRRLRFTNVKEKATTTRKKN